MIRHLWKLLAALAVVCWGTWAFLIWRSFVGPESESAITLRTLAFFLGIGAAAGARELRKAE